MDRTLPEVKLRRNSVALPEKWTAPHRDSHSHPSHLNKWSAKKTDSAPIAGRAQRFTRSHELLFLDAPIAGLVTDMYGTIIEANAEAGAM